MIRVFLVDDQALVREGTAMLVRSQSDMFVAGHASNGADAVRHIARTPCDVVLMDVRMPHMSGVEATSRVLARPGAPKVVVLTTYDLDEYAFAALRAGASGFLLKDSEPEAILAAIRDVYSGDAVIAPSTTRRLLDHVVADLPAPSAGRDPLGPLTRREREVLMEVVLGRSNAEVAARLRLTEGTVKVHVGRILNKLGLRDRVHAVIWAYDNRVVRPGAPSS